MRKKGAKAATAQPARTQDGCRFGLSRASPLLVGCRLCFERDPARAWPRSCAEMAASKMAPLLDQRHHGGLFMPLGARVRELVQLLGVEEGRCDHALLAPPLLEQRLELRRERHRRRGPLASLGSVGVVRCGSVRSVPTSVRSVPTAGADR